MLALSATLVVVLLGSSRCSATTLPRSISLSPAVKVGGGGVYQAWTVASLPVPPPAPAAAGGEGESDEPAHASLFIDTAAGIMQSDDGGAMWRSARVDPKLKLGLTTMRASTADRGSIHGFGDMTAKYQRQRTPFTAFTGTDPAFFELGPGRALQATVHSKPCAGSAGCANLSATGLPRGIGCIQTSCCNCPFRFDSGNTVRLPDGSLVISVNVYYKPEQPIKGDGSSVAVFSSDREGLNWKWRSDVATAEDYQWSGEGPNESTISLLSDGKTLICILRMDAGDGHATGKPYSKRLSTDQVRCHLRWQTVCSAGPSCCLPSHFDRWIRSHRRERMVVEAGLCGVRWS